MIGRAIRRVAQSATALALAMIFMGAKPAAHSRHGGLTICKRTTVDASCTTPTLATADGDMFVDGNFEVQTASRLRGTITATAGTMSLHRGAQVTAANSMTLGVGNLFTVSGNTQINFMTARPAGTLAVLLFSGTPTVKKCVTCDGTTFNFLLASDFVATANDQLTLMSNGTFWIEIARSAN